MQIFKVIKAGVLTTMQDSGRYGYLARGVSESGALDEHAYYWGNYLLNNSVNSTSLEISIGGCELIALSNTNVVITGANLDFCINNTPAPTWQVVKINKGDILKWIKPISGIRAYLAINGGFTEQKYFASTSVNTRENIGAKITNNDILSANLSTNNNYKTMLREFIPDYNQDLLLRILFNNNDYFKPQDQQQFTQTIYTISNKNDRSAYQLNTANIKPKVKQFYSEANNYGSVQITPNGAPIIMLRDRPTIGGYPKIGTVFSLDLAKLAQKSTGDKVRFNPISIEDMQHKRQEFDRFFSQENTV